MSKKQNPYIAGNHVGKGQAFIGRADVLRNALRMLNNQAVPEALKSSLHSITAKKK